MAARRLAEQRRAQTETPVAPVRPDDAEDQEAVEEQIEVDKRRSSKRLRVGVMEADRRLSPRAWVGVGVGGDGGRDRGGQEAFPLSV